MYNREKFIGRALNSCLNQYFTDYEIIVVDDGSTDNSVEAVKSYTDSRIKLICHSVNRGVGPARNTGADEAKGEWIICLDSDDELLPGALSIIYQRATEVGDEISRLQFMVQFDTGEISPDPPLKDDIWDYEGYIRWMERSYRKRSETLPIVRRKTFSEVRYSDDRTLEGPYHLDFVKRFFTRSCPDVVRLYHFDSENQLTKPDMFRTLESASTQASGIERMIKLHSDALSKWSPRVYANQISGLATLQFLSGNKLKGLKYATHCLQSNPFGIKIWAIIVFGLLGPKPLAWLKTSRHERHKDRNVR